MGARVGRERGIVECSVREIGRRVKATVLWWTIKDCPGHESSREGAVWPLAPRPPPMSHPLALVRAEIKTWERDFASRHGRDPSLQDIRSHPPIGAPSFYAFPLTLTVLQPRNTSSTRSFPRQLPPQPALLELVFPDQSPGLPTPSLSPDSTPSPPSRNPLHAITPRIQTHSQLPPRITQHPLLTRSRPSCRPTRTLPRLLLVLTPGPQPQSLVLASVYAGNRSPPPPTNQSASAPARRLPHPN